MSDSPVKDFPMDAPIPRWAVERMTTDVVSLAIATYDATVSKPRHEENSKRFDELEAGQTNMTNILNQIKGAMKVFVVLASLVTFAGGVLGIIHLIRIH